MGIREERLARAASMPHRKDAQEDSIDTRLESTIGRFYFQGHITEPEFQAGVRYGQICLDYLQSIDAPTPYGNGFRDLPDDDCFVRKIMMAQSRQILKDAAAASTRISARRVIAAVDRLAVYGEGPRSLEEFKALRVGLRALAHGSNVVKLRQI